MNNQNIITNEELAKAFEGEKSEGRGRAMTKTKKSKKMLVMLIVGICGMVGGATMILVSLLVLHKEAVSVEFAKDKDNDSKIIYSKLTGEKLADESMVDAPVYCIQTPNGTDGARPQSGLNEAGVVFEAIAEAGITRFAAIYQNPTSAVIGPIRSLRMYYLQWDTPFDCTIVHAGGAADALAAVASGGYKDLTENYTYMYRGTYGGRLWNNLFTTSALLRQYSQDSGNTSSDVKGFARMTPEESLKERVDSSVGEKLVIVAPASGDVATMTPTVTAVGVRFGGLPNFNVDYTYDAENNTYARSYQSGAAHEVYGCSAEDLGEKNPEDVCSLTQLKPSVVVAMVVSEHRASDNYHEDIASIGSGKAYVFQNGGVVQGSWKKDSAADQIKFTDADGKEIKLAPGQTFVSAVPDYGSVDF